MRITKLSLTNFRSFKETQTIEFAPITLLFGPNSVGKSSVLMSLFYLQQIIEKGQCNPQRLEALGNKFVGGFKNLVNGRDLSKSITIKVEYDKLGSIGSTYGQTVALLTDPENDIEPPLIIEDQASSTDKVALEFVISWSKPMKTAYVEQFSVWLNDEYLGKTFCDEGLKNPVLVDLNLFHSVLLPSNHDDWLDEFYEGGPVFLSSKWASHFNQAERGYGHEFDDHFRDDGIISQFDFELGRFAKFGFNAFTGALPVIGKVLETAFSHDSNAVTAIVNEVLSEVLVSPLDNLLEILNDSVCIGPLRCIPDVTYQANQYSAQADWYDGRACWDKLNSLDLVQTTSINEWLSSADKLNLGFKLVYKTEDTESRFITPTLKFKTVEDVLALSDAIGDQLKVGVSKENLEDTPDAENSPVSNDYLEEMRKSKDIYSELYIGQRIDKVSVLTLWDCINNIEVSSSDIGVGVSQLFPLVAASQTLNKGIIACEQPELHVHPRVQVAIGDLLTQNENDTSFLIESHSEHLILRILRRIRETTDDELPEGLNSVLPKSVSIVYLESSSEGVTARQIQIDNDGEIDGHWPEGFFEERAKELF
jgi:predicted ATPase